MRLPIPKNRLVAFTLVGALLTTVVAGALAFPGLGLVADRDSSAPSVDVSTSEQIADDAPTPNRDFTPAVRTQSSHGEDEEHDDEADEEHDDEADEEHDDEADEEHDGEADEEHDDGEHEA